MTPAIPARSHQRPGSTQVTVFRESLHGLVRPVDPTVAPSEDRLECAIALESVLIENGDMHVLSGCTLQDLTIAVDVGAPTADGALPGVVRSGLVEVDGLGGMQVTHGQFELFPRAAGDARRLRYRLWLRHPDGSRWFLRGTKLVVNEARGLLIRRVWAETTTLYVVLFPLSDDTAQPTPDPASACYVGVVRVRPVDFAFQLMSLHGEPGPAGGLRAVAKLASTFWSVIGEVYWHGDSSQTFAPGIEVAFTQPSIEPAYPTDGNRAE